MWLLPPFTEEEAEPGEVKGHVTVTQLLRDRLGSIF